MTKAKRTLAALFVTLGVVLALALVANVVFSWIAGVRLERRIAKLRAAGEPTSLAELAREAIRPEQNAAVVLGRIAKDLAAIEKDLQPLYEAGLSADAPTDEQLATIKRTLSAYPQVVLTIRDAAECPHYDSKPELTLEQDKFLESLLGETQLRRRVARLLDLHVTVLLTENQREEALRDGIRSFELARHFDQEPMMVGYLVSLACREIAMDSVNRVLRDGPIGAADRAMLDRELARHDAMPALMWALRSDRAFGLDYFRTMTSGWRGVLLMWHFKTDQSQYLDVIDEQLALGAVSWFEMPREAQQLEAQAAGLRPIVSSITPALTATREATNRTRARMRCLRVLAAVLARGIEDQEAPIDLAALGLPEEATIDPYTGQPLRIKQTPEGWIVYSVGANRIDDGGTLDGTKDIGVGPLPRESTKE
jgi:hypothetical protein